jgi:hypothetical protein
MTYDVMKLLQARTKTTLTDLIEKATFGCIFFEVASPEVCTGLVNRFGPTVHYILTSRTELTANTFCGIVLQAQGCAVMRLQTEWNIDLSYPRIGVAGGDSNGARRFGSNAIGSNSVVLDNFVSQVRKCGY